MDHPSSSTQRPAGQASGRARLPHPAPAARPNPRGSAARPGPGERPGAPARSRTAAPAAAPARGTAWHPRRGRSLPAATLALARRAARPGNRLTGLGTGVVTTAITLSGGAVDALLFGGPGVLFGLVFLLASTAGALWVRAGDLAAAPISAPIAFAVALALTGTSGSGLLGHALSLVASLATHATWLYCGTLLSAAVAAARRAARRRPARR